MSKKKILVVDDEEDARTLLKSRLEANHYRVVTACDGLDALDKVTTEKPDLILLDIMMPRMDGSEFLQRMKSEGHLEQIPVIVLTAKASMREFFLVKGAADFIVKPFLSKNLLAEIEKHMQSDLRA